MIFKTEYLPKVRNTNINFFNMSLIRYNLIIFKLEMLNEQEWSNT